MSPSTWTTGLAGLAMLTATYCAAAPASQPYADMRTRAIKALSDEQIADLRAGRGMALALAAELNGYPGPAHLLELAGQLDLTVEQTPTLRADVRRDEARDDPGRATTASPRKRTSIAASPIER